LRRHGLNNNPRRKIVRRSLPRLHNGLGGHNVFAFAALTPARLI
jgi:hypothetical protein